MDRKPDLIAATRRMDLDEILWCLETDPRCIEQRDLDGNNAMHLCVAGGAAIRAPHLMKHFLEATTLDLRQANRWGRDPLFLAMALRDEDAYQMIEPYYWAQAIAKLPPDPSPNLRIVGASKRGPKL